MEELTKYLARRLTVRNRWNAVATDSHWTICPPSSVLSPPPSEDPVTIIPLPSFTIAGGLTWCCIRGEGLAFPVPRGYPQTPKAGWCLHWTVKKILQTARVSPLCWKCLKFPGLGQWEKNMWLNWLVLFPHKEEQGRAAARKWLCYSRIDVARNHPHRDFPIQPDMLAQYWSQSTLEQLSPSCSFVCWTWRRWSLCSINNPQKMEEITETFSQTLDLFPLLLFSFW